MSTKLSPAAMKAQAAMFQMLATHFDPDAGQYETGWNDARVAKEAGLAADFVVEFRRNGFGELKEPAPLAALRSDINALEKLQVEQNATFAQQLAELRAQLARIAAQFAPA